MMELIKPEDLTVIISGLSVVPEPYDDKVKLKIVHDPSGKYVERTCDRKDEHKTKKEMIEELNRLVNGTIGEN